MIKKILLVLSVLLFSAVPFSSSAQTCSLDQFGGSAGDRVFTCSPDNASYSITFPLFPSRGTTIQYASLGTVSGNTISGIPAGQAVQVTMANPGCSNTVTRWMRWCCPTPVTSCPPERIWRAIGSPDNNGSASYYDMMFENEVTGEIRHAFCTEIDMGGPGVGSRYCLAADDLTLNPVSRCTQQIMYIFGSKCDYEKPVMDGIPSTCSSNSNSLTASCAQGTPMWYKKDAIGLTFLGSGNNAPSGFSSLRNYVRCENNDATCFSEYVTVNISNNSDATPIPVPSKTEVCVGETVNLSLEEGCDSRAGFFDKWYQGTTPLASPVVSPTVTTTYTLRCVNTRGCDVTETPANVIITVDPGCTAPCDVIPNPTIAGDMEICQGQSTSLTASGCTAGFTYLWSNNATTASITVNTGGTYTVKCVQASRPDCESAIPGTVTVTSNTTPVITLGTPSCSGGAPTYFIPFTVTAGAVLTSSVGTFTEEVLGSRSLRGIPPGTEVTIQATLGNCTVTEVFTTPSAACTCVGAKPNTMWPQTFCYGDTVISISANPSTGGYFAYKYFKSDGVEILPGEVYIATENTTLTHGYVALGEECIDGDRGIFEITVIPPPSITAGTPVCAPNALSYSVDFTIPSGATITGTTAGTISGNSVINIPSGTSATVTVESAEGCENTATVTHTCFVCIAPNPTVSENTSICAGQSTTLTAEGCTTGYTYLWSSGATTAAITVTPTANTTYTVKCVETGRPECESITPGSATVVVNPIPTITAGTPVCAPDGQTYSVTFTIPAGATITTTAGTVTGNVVSGINSGVTATITVTSAEGCTNTTMVTQNCTIPCNAPNPTVTGDLEICTGESTTLTASGCTTGYTYLWFTGATTAAITVTPTTNTTYTVKCVETGRPECESITPGSATVVVNPIPTITAGTPVCTPDGQTYSVTFTIPAGATIATTAGTVTGNVVSGINSGVTATITVTSAEGCTNTTTVMQNCTVPCNAPNPTVTGDLEICAGESTTLTASGCTTGYTYLWSTGATTAAITVTPTANATYTVKCVETGRPECESINPGSATVVVNPIPTITAGTPVCAPDGQTYSVTFTIPAGATIASTSGTVSGNVVSGISSGVTSTITVTSVEGCTNTTTVTQNCTVPVFDLALRKVMPNGTKNTPVTPGSSVTFKIEVWNQGNVDATDISVIDYIPAGLILNDPKWTPGTGVATLTNPIAALAAGDSTSVTITFTVDAAFTGSAIRNFAEISGADNEDDLEDIDSTPDSNPGNDGTPVDDKIDEDHKNNPDEDEDDHDYEDLVVTPTPVFDLALRKTMAPGSKTIYKVGDVVTFDITVFNQGTVTATSVDLVDYIPTGLTLQTGSDWTMDGDKARWNGAITNLAAGAQEVVSITFIVNASATGVILNTAEISGATNPENLEDIDSTPDDDKDNDGPGKNDVINEDGKNNAEEDEDDHDIEPITICPDAKCITAKSVRNK
jgi:uncharacterized repeat protein (TIGR01451 family)